MSIWKKLFGASPTPPPSLGTAGGGPEDGFAKTPERRTFHHLFIGRDSVVIPTVARTTTGLFLDFEPVAVLPLSDPAAIRASLTELITQGNPEIPLPPRDAYRPPAGRYAGIKSWPALIRKFDCIGFSQEGDEFRIDFSPHDAMADDPARARRVPAADIVAEVLGQILATKTVTADSEAPHGS
ncbi:MAG: hypothetical protein P4L99_17340 [Chthoniobacter sp.]|nr:hypothetical protein [Chthoniobacter sp.]